MSGACATGSRQVRERWQGKLDQHAETAEKAKEPITRAVIYRTWAFRLPLQPSNFETATALALYIKL